MIDINSLSSVVTLTPEHSEELSVADPSNDQKNCEADPDQLPWGAGKLETQSRPGIRIMRERR